MSEESGAKLRRRVESLFHDALAKSAEEREKFLVEACQDDEPVYREVKSLLAHWQQSTPLDRPLLPHSATPALSEGNKIGSYEIIRQLGRGGMGEVYLARDSGLGRKVALKILPRSLADNPELIERLRREAQTASALNHPNILTIFEFGQQGDVQYIVTEFVEGTELRELIGRLSTAEILDYAHQIAQALAAAHSVGIIHRDIKPENIMVRSDGYIKVLDFGLAKLAGPQLQNGESLYERLCGSAAATVPGLLVGTINYMSPEQVRGHAVDQRTDIWSWGVVLYEMLAGKRPFEGATPSDVLAGILNQEPGPPGNNKRIHEIVAKALSKRPEGRFQTAAEVLRALRGVQEVSVWKHLPRLIHPRLAWRILAPAFLLVLVAAAVYLLYPRSQQLRVESMVRLTTSGNVKESAISPDGRYVAYATEEDGGEALKVSQIGTGTESEKLPPARGEYRGITFSRDGRFIYYVFLQNQLGKLYRVPVVGGDSRMVVEDVDSPISFSPDGSRFVFVRNSPLRHEVSLITNSTERDSEVTLATLKSPDNFWNQPIWSWDGTFVLCGVYRDSPIGKSNVKFMAVRLKDRQLLEVGPEPWYWMGKPVWIKDGKSFAIAATSVYSNRPQLMEVSWPSGNISPITHDTADYRNLDSTADSRKIVTIVVERESNIWTVPLNAAGRASLVARGKYYGIAWTPSGGLISQTDTGGHPELWLLDPKTGKSRPITDDGYVKQDPAVTPDGSYLLYASLRDRGFHLWRSSLDGYNSVRLTSGPWKETQAASTPDGKWVVYTSNPAGFEALWKVSINGGVPTVLTSHNSNKPSVSPDGVLLACKYADDPGGTWSTVILRVGTGEVVRSFPAIPQESAVRWSADGRNLLFDVTDAGTSNIWAQPVDGGKARQLTHFSEGLIFSFAPSPDGKALACVRGTRTSNLVLIHTAR
ncbi:MAG TPA: protein kinase [Candidatus Angelobacter sp.]|nr:protein kinase [Candidatus Angelobacter sp.]